jgi:hypothetical protein
MGAASASKVLERIATGIGFVIGVGIVIFGVWMVLA